MIVRRFLAIFLDPAVNQKINLTLKIGQEQFFAGFKVQLSAGYLDIMQYSFSKGNKETASDPEELIRRLSGIKKGSVLPVDSYEIKEGETTPPKRYNSGSIILAMENAGQLIEDEELREQIKGSGIGTSATRSGILEKLIKNQYLANQKKTQIITPTLMGEMIYDIVDSSIRSLLNPSLTASWEKGLTYVAEGSITTDEYMQKLEHFIRVRTAQVMNLKNQYQVGQSFKKALPYYRKEKKGKAAPRRPVGKDSVKKGSSEG